MSKTIRISSHAPALILLAATLALLPVRPAAAQGLPRPALRLEGGLVGAAAFADPPDKELAAGDARVATTASAATFVYPVVLGGGHTLLFLEAGWRDLQLGRRTWPSSISGEPDRLHEVSAAVTGRTMLGERWALTARLQPLLASDFRGRGLDDGDVKFQGAVVVERSVSPAWTLGLGAAYASTFGEPLPLPLLVARYMDEHWLLDAALPSSVLAVRHLSSRVDAGLSLTAEGSLYHIPDVYPESLGIDDPQFQYIAVFAGPVLAVRPTDGSALTLRGGVAWQSLRLFDGVTEIPHTNYDLDLEFFTRIGVEILL